MKKGKGKGQVQGAGGNSVGKGGGKAKSQTEVPSRRGVAERPSCHGQHRRPRGSVFAGGIEKDEAGSVPWPGLGTSRSMCAVYLSSREASPQGRRSAGKVAGRSYKFGPRARRGTGSFGGVACRSFSGNGCTSTTFWRSRWDRGSTKTPTVGRESSQPSQFSRGGKRRPMAWCRGVVGGDSRTEHPASVPTIQPLSKKFDLIEQADGKRRRVLAIAEGVEW